MLVLVALAIVADGAFAACSTRDDGYRPGLAERTAKRIGVVAFVGEHVVGAAHAGEQRGCSSYVGDIAGCEHQREGAADDIREGVVNQKTPLTSNR